MITHPARPYRGYDVLAKWDSVSYDATTRAVLRRRLLAIPQRRFLTEHEWALTTVIAARLVRTPFDRLSPPIVPWIDEMLDRDQGEGFRYADMPPLRDAWRRGLAGIDAQAHAKFDRSFIALDAGQCDAVLRDVQCGRVDAAAWHGLSARRFFVHVLLKTIAGLHYAHPSSWSEIGFGGPASPRGYVRLGFDARDPWDAREETAAPSPDRDRQAAMDVHATGDKAVRTP